MDASSSSNSGEKSHAFGQLISVQLAQLLGSKTSAADDFESLNVLGTGSHGVTRVVRRKHDGIVLCRKEIPYERFPTARPSDVLREVEILMMLDGHPHAIADTAADHRGRADYGQHRWEAEGE